MNENQQEESINSDELDEILAENSFTSDQKTNSPPESILISNIPKQKSSPKISNTNTKRRKPFISRKIDIDEILNNIPTNIEKPELQTAPIQTNTQENPPSPQVITIPNTLLQVNQHIEDYLKSKLFSFKIDFLNAVNNLLDRSNDISLITNDFLLHLKDDIKENISFSIKTDHGISIEDDLLQYQPLIKNSINSKLYNYDTQSIIHSHSLIKGSQPILDDFNQMKNDLISTIKKSMKYEKYNKPKQANLEKLKSKRMDLEAQLAFIDLEIAYAKDCTEKLQKLRNQNSFSNSLYEDEEKSDYNTAFSLLKELNDEIQHDSSKVCSILQSTSHDNEIEFKSMMDLTSDWIDELLTSFDSLSSPLPSPTSPRRKTRISMTDEYDESSDDRENKLKINHAKSLNSFRGIKTPTRDIYDRRRQNETEIFNDSDSFTDTLNPNLINFAKSYSHINYV